MGQPYSKRSFDGGSASKTLNQHRNSVRFAFSGTAFEEDAGLCKLVTVATPLTYPGRACPRSPLRLANSTRAPWPPGSGRSRAAGCAVWRPAAWIPPNPSPAGASTGSRDRSWTPRNRAARWGGSPRPGPGRSCPPCSRARRTSRCTVWSRWSNRIYPPWIQPSLISPFVNLTAWARIRLCFPCFVAFSHRVNTLWNSSRYHLQLTGWFVDPVTGGRQHVALDTSGEASRRASPRDVY